MTYQEAIQALVALDVARWGEGERQASTQLRRRNSPTIGLALNALAHYDVENIDGALASEARQLMTADDWRILKQGG